MQIVLCNQSVIFKDLISSQRKREPKLVDFEQELAKKGRLKVVKVLHGFEVRGEAGDDELLV